MYDATAILKSLDANLVPFLVIGGLAMMFNYLYFAGAMIAARRDRAFTFPLVCTTLWFAHDLSFVLAYDSWFNTYQHWYTELFWLALIPTTLIEAAFIHQTWRYGRDELLPQRSQAAFNAYMVLAIIAGGIGWWSLKHFLDDPIYAYTFGSTGYLAPAFVIPLMLRRGHAKGQSVLTWAAYTGMQTCWFSAVLLFFGPAFHTPTYLTMAAASVLGGVAITTLTWHLKRKP